VTSGGRSVLADFGTNLTADLTIVLKGQDRGH
jgi:hypothetical protein